ncbi:MAG: YfhO family protein [Clostridia bacterium]|nr:YfhO family protein [Clostridia bacterium]
MTFSYMKKHSLAPKRERGLATFLLALGIATAFFTPFIVFGDGYFIFYGDFNVQQIPFYQLCHDAIRSGNINWSWNTDLGSSFIPSYSFYTLGSPFFWLTLPFPNFMLPYLMGPLLILKFACAALTSYYFIRRFTRTPFAAQIGALLYAFSGFSIYNIFFNHFHEAIVFFPLLLLSIELLITENKRGYFAVCVALCAVVNYFFFFGMVVFTIIYWFIRTISGAYKFRISRFFTIIAEAVIGVLLSAFILLPSLFILLSNTRVNDILIGWSGILYGKEQIYLNIIECFFFPPDIPARPVFFPGANVKWSSLGGWLPLFSMTAVIGFCASKKKHWISRLIKVCTFMALVPFLNSAFYAFNDSYYARWFYMPVLIMSLCSAITLEDKTVDWKKGFWYTAVVTVAIAAVVGLFPQRVDGKIVLGLYTDAGDDNTTYLYRFLIAVALALASLLICSLLIYLRDKDKKPALRRLTVAFLSLIIICYSCVYLYQGSSHSYNQHEVMIPKLIEGKVELPTDEHYRIDTYDCVDNTGMYLGYPTINAFHSVVSPSIMEYYDFIDVNRDVASRPTREYFSIRSLLSVKYLLNRTDGDSFINDEGYTIMPAYEYVKTDGGYYVYENKAYIPYGFSYDYYITQGECEGYYTDTARADVMLKAIVLSEDDALKYSSGMTSYSEYSDNYVEPEEPYEELLPDDPIFDVEQNEGESQIDSENKIESEVISSENSSEQVYLPDDEYVMSLSMSEDELLKDALHLAESSAYEFTTDNKGFTAKVSRDKTTLVFFSVPYDKGWSATVNGQKAEIIKANIGFMAVQVTEGDSEIRFDYTPPWLKTGLLVSGGALLVFIIYITAAVSFKRSRKANEVYPEGDALIEEWSRYEFEIAEEEAKNQNVGVLDKMGEETDSLLPEDNTKYHTGFQIDTSAFSEKSVDKNKDE